MGNTLRRLVAFVGIGLALVVFFTWSEERGLSVLDWVRDPQEAQFRHEALMARDQAAQQGRQGGGRRPADRPRTSAPAAGTSADSSPSPSLGGAMGRVVRLDGSPVAGLGLVAEPPALGRAVSDELGRFELPAAAIDVPVAPASEDWVLLGAGTGLGEGGVEQRLVVVAERISLTGRVSDPAGRPLAGALVVAFTPIAPGAGPDVTIGLPERFERRALTDELGRFELLALPRLPFLRVDASLEGYRTLRSGVPDEREVELEIALEPGR